LHFAQKYDILRGHANRILFTQKRYTAHISGGILFCNKILLTNKIINKINE